ncbi:MAG: hypothetical protein ACFFB0_17525 [Promethearchaeota archaeon]
MQIFEVVPLTKFPYMETREVLQGNTVRDILNETSKEKVYLLVDHDTKKIWTFNGSHSSFKVQIYGGILAGMLRQQLRLFYRVYPLNMYSSDNQEFQNIMEKPLGAGRAKPIEKNDFAKPTEDKYIKDVSIASPKANKAIEYINSFPKPDDLIRRFIVIGGTIYNEEEIIEAFVKEEKNVTNTVKLGRLNNGFTFFKDHNYSTRLIIKDRKIQGIELYIHKDDKSPPLESQIPVLYEEKYSKPGSFNALIKAFKIPDKLPEDTETTAQDDSTNQS